MTLHFLMIANDPDMAGYALANGVDMLFVDLEVLGKATRQGHYDSWKSDAGPQDISTLRDALPDAQILVRVNPYHEGTGSEVEDAIARGADALMLPMFRDADDVARFRDMIAGRARCIPLVETADALRDMATVARHSDQVHIGLNDLSLDLGLPFMFQPLADGLLDAPAAALRESGTPFGIGGIARAGSGAVPPETVLGEHARLGSDWVILSRSFHDRAETVGDLRDRMDFGREILRLRAIHDRFASASPAELARNRAVFREQVAAVVDRLTA